MGGEQQDLSGQFSIRARKSLELANAEAKRFNHNYIGTEHILLGLAAEGEGAAAKVLERLGVELQAARSAVEFIIGRGDRTVMGEIGLTPRAKKVLELARDEARRLRHPYVGTEHLLLGLIREGEGIAAGVLESLGVNLEKVRHEVLKMIGGEPPSPQARASHRPPVTSPTPVRISREWEYLVLPVAFIDGSPSTRPFFADQPFDYEIANLPVMEALTVLGQDGWELAGVDPSHRTHEGPGALYIFKRPV